MAVNFDMIIIFSQLYLKKPICINKIQIGANMTYIICIYHHFII